MRKGASTHFSITRGHAARGDLRVVSFRGSEALSRPFQFDIVVTTRTLDDATFEADTLGWPAELALHIDTNRARYVRGIVADVEAQGAFERNARAYRLRLVPRLWLLSHRTTSRIFQDMTAVEVVSAVLGEAEIPHRFSMLGVSPKRAYCVQYQESDLSFVTRLLAEEGIFFWFDHGGAEADAEMVVFSDSSHFYARMEGEHELLFRYADGNAALTKEEHYVQRFTCRRTLLPTAVLGRVYDFRRPMQDLRTAAGVPESDNPSHPKRCEIYEHHGEYEEPEVGLAKASVQLEQHRARAVEAHGESACRRLLPGYRFQLIDHAIDDLNRQYVVTEVQHEGVFDSAGQGNTPVYHNSFVCVPAEVSARPPRRDRRVSQVAETATVVGPRDQEIYTDAHGRVKVQFHWDRAGNHDEHSSCWIRVAQAWAGRGWGVQFIPRVGMEVVVTFLGGDVDRPLITGCVPNAINVPPFCLPSNPTTSGIRTQSTPGGEGFNELRFEDRTSNEQVYLHAQRDFDEVVGRNHTLVVKGGELIAVQGDRIGAVAGAVQERVEGDFTTRVGGCVRREIVGTEDVVVRGDLTTRVRGCHTMLVGAENAKRSYVLHVEGVTQLSGSGISEIKSDKAIVLSCGRSSIRITDAKIEINAPAISVSGEGGRVCIDEDTATLRGKRDAQILAERVLLKAASASVGLNEDAQIDGKRILLNSPLSATDPVKDKTPELTTIELMDQTGRPLAHHLYLIVLEDGSEVCGSLDKNGRAEVELAGAGSISFPGLREAKAM